MAIAPCASFFFLVQHTVCGYHFFVKQKKIKIQYKRRHLCLFTHTFVMLPSTSDVAVPSLPTSGPRLRCLAGYTNVVNATSNAAECVACAAGKYMSIEGSVLCTACPDAQHMRSSQGSTSLLDCLCMPGLHGPDANGTCTACSKDHYKVPFGSFPCSQCPAHMSSPNTSSSLLACTCNTGFAGPAGGPCVGVCTHEAVRISFLRVHSDRGLTEYDIKLSCDWELAAFYREYADRHTCRYLAGSMYMCAANK